MKVVKVLAMIALVIAVFAVGIWQFWLKPQVAFAQVATAYGAKQVCSCRFVAERELQSCFGDFTDDIGQIEFSVSSSRVTENGEARAGDTVTASVLGGFIKNQARFEPGLGCTVVVP